jgi:hypothetical protein
MVYKESVVTYFRKLPLDRCGVCSGKRIPDSRSMFSFVPIRLLQSINTLSSEEKEKVRAHIRHNNFIVWNNK